MPSDRLNDGLWIGEMDGPERHERAKKRRADQIKRWQNRETTANGEPQSKRPHKKTLKFTPNIVILDAAARNDQDEVASLLESGVNPDLANEDGLTALHQSCIDGCDDMVKYLIEHNANVNACDNERWTPLHAAAACGHLSIIKYLIKNGGDIMALNLDGNLPVGVVEENEEVVKFLDEEMSKLGYEEADIEELRLNEGKELLHDLKDSICKGRSLDLQDENGATAFHVAAANGWTNVIDFLLENDADFEIEDNDGWQPIHAAAAWGHDTVLEVLAASGADLDSKTNDSKTPLDLTEEDEIIELIEELKTKEVKYPRKGKGVRRKRSNTSNSSIKRTSIHDKCELSQADIKAEGAEFLMQLQNTESNAVSSITATEELKQSLERKDKHDKPSSFVSEESNEIKTKNEDEPIKSSKINARIDEKKSENSGSLKILTDTPKVNVTGNQAKLKEQGIRIVQQSPVPKPPRLGTSNTARLDPQAYINFEIKPIDRKASNNKPDKDIKPDIKDILSSNVGISDNESKSELKLKASSQENANQLKTRSMKNANENENTKQVEKRTASTLPKLQATDKRKAPKPPDVATSANQKTKKETKKGTGSRKTSSESSTKKRCVIQ